MGGIVPTFPTTVEPLATFEATFNHNFDEKTVYVYDVLISCFDLKQLGWMLGQLFKHLHTPSVGKIGKKVSPVQ